MLVSALLASSAHFDAIWRQREVLAARPSLLLWGMKDRAFPPRLLERWRQALPSAQVSEFPEAGHWPQEEAPAEFIAALRQFLVHSEPSARPTET